MRYLHVLLALTLDAAVAMGCSRGASDPPMSEDRFVDLYLQVERLRQRYPSSPDSLREHREELFRTRGIKAEDIERAISWYRGHPDRGTVMLERIAKQLEAEKAGVQGSARPRD